jgi:hypothetical protein
MGPNQKRHWRLPLDVSRIGPCRQQALSGLLLLLQLLVLLLKLLGGAIDPLLGLLLLQAHLLRLLALRLAPLLGALLPLGVLVVVTVVVGLADLALLDEAPDVLLDGVLWGASCGRVPDMMLLVSWGDGIPSQAPTVQSALDALLRICDATVLRAPRRHLRPARLEVVLESLEREQYCTSSRGPSLPADSRTRTSNNRKI